MAEQKEENLLRNNDGHILDEQSLKRVIEALIFASDKPLSVQQIKDIVGDIDSRVIRRLINELMQQCPQGQRSFGITELAGGFQFTTNPAYGRWIKRLYNIKQKDYLTAPSLETLAIIAYRQPVTKTDIEDIRGVNVDGVINNLLHRGLIRITGRKEVVGRPFLYATTNLFLQYFGLNSVQELPALPEFRAADLKIPLRGNPPVEATEDDKGTGDNSPVEATEDDKGTVPSDGDEDGKTQEVTEENRPD